MKEPKVYIVDYSETYSRQYSVVAQSPEEAESKLRKDIEYGLAGPDICIDSKAEIVGTDDPKNYLFPDVE